VKHGAAERKASPSGAKAVALRARGATRRVHRVGGDRVDIDAREVRVAGAPVEVSAMEFSLLTTLASDPRRVFTQDELLRVVWAFQRPAAREPWTRTPAACGASSPSTVRGPS
jgi:DNA-binding response OmpR family regulator